MATASKRPPAHRVPASSSEVRRICGNLDDDKVNAVLALAPTVEDLEEAASWVTGTGDLLSRGGRPLAGIVADVVAILQADDEVKAALRR